MKYHNIVLALFPVLSKFIIAPGANLNKIIHKFFVVTALQLNFYNLSVLYNYALVIYKQNAQSALIPVPDEQNVCAQVRVERM